MRPSPSPRRLPPVGQHGAYIVGVHHVGEGITGIECLAGDYFEDGENHRHKAYTKRVPPGSTDAEANVTFYYWDETDGVEFSGWWFGNGPEGQRVSSRIPSHSMTPAPTGWLVPRNGVAIPGLLSVKRPMPVILPDDPDDWGRSWVEEARCCAGLGRHQESPETDVCLD